jgi:hypothetical protein
MVRQIFYRIVLIALVVCGLLVFCGVSFAKGPSNAALNHAIQVQEKYTKALMAKAGVVGTAVGSGEAVQPVVFVLLEYGGVPGIPDSLDGVPVRPLVTGKIYALVKPENPGQGHKGGKSPKPTDWWPRPVPIGVSTGNANECSAGTIGCRVTDGTNFYALSNNHVYARENNANDGEEVLQPGLFDTHCFYYSDNVIGTLSAFVPIEFSQDADNVVDAAIAITTTDDLDNATPSDGYSVPNSTTAAAELGQNVQKYGRTTGLTKGIVYAINATVPITYDSGTAQFERQIVVYSSKGPFIRAGDSGSLVVTDDENKNPVGLVFAGDVSGHIAFANPIDDVLGELSDAIGSTIAIDGD